MHTVRVGRRVVLREIKEHSGFAKARERVAIDDGGLMECRGILYVQQGCAEWMNALSRDRLSSANMMRTNGCG